MMEALDVVTGETRCFTNDWTPDYTGGFILSHPDASDSLILAHQDWLEENTGRVLVNPVHRMWGWSLPAGISDWSYSVLEGLPDGWRGWWVPKMDVPEIVKQFNSIEVEVIL